MNEEDMKKTRERLEGLVERERSRVQYNYSTDKRHLIKLSQDSRWGDLIRDYERLGKMISDYRRFAAIINLAYSTLCSEFKFPSETISVPDINQS